jgi:glutathione S-transferase
MHRRRACLGSRGRVQSLKEILKKWADIMKLYFGKTSPYVRKVLVAAIEAGIDDQIKCEEVLPWEAGTDYNSVNPLGKIPALMTDDGVLLYDSRVIVEHLDTLSSTLILIPTDHGARMNCLRLGSLGDGMMEAMILVFSELERRPDALQWDYWIERMTGKVHDALDQLETEVADFDTHTPDLAQITAACAIGWLEFRKHILGIDFRPGRQNLATWFDTFDQRPSMRRTIPVAH